MSLDEDGEEEELAGKWAFDDMALVFDGVGWVLGVGTVFDSALTCCSGIVLYIIGTFIAMVFVGTVFDSALIVVMFEEYRKKYIA